MFSTIKIHRQDLENTYNSVPDHIKSDGQGTSIALGGAVLRHFFGKDWFEKYIVSDYGKKYFLSVDESHPTKQLETVFRIVDLAELLYNLQNIPNFDDCIKRMYEGELESTYAELGIGRMLFMHRVPFAYVKPQGIKGLDYDVEVTMPNGLVACGEAKCKIETTQLSENTIRNALDQARKQLPARNQISPDRPQVIFVKIPASWLENSNTAKITQAVAKEFLTTTKRIVSVKYYVSPAKWDDGMMMRQHASQEVYNPYTDFGNFGNWQTFPHMDIPPEWNGMPPWWQRILFYPDGKPR